MNPILKKSLVGVAALVAVTALAAGAYAYTQVAAFDASMEKVYDVPIPTIERSTDPVVLARGKHLAQSLGGCAISDCHGPELAGGQTLELGPLGTMTAPNITGAGLGAAYSDGELARLIEHGVKKDGRSVRFMASHEFNWLPQSDIVAVISHVRSVPDVVKENGPLELGVLAKVLDRRDQIVIDIARRVNHEHIEKAPPPSPTKEYGRYIGLFCVGCHGHTFGGGPIPGAPPDLPVPPNITPDPSGIKDWTYEDFTRLLDSGMRKNGKKLDPFMPLSALTAMDETERKALWLFLQSLPPKPTGSR